MQQQIPIEAHRASHEPTPAQIAAGNYRKRAVAWRGLTISIENEPGSVRRGVDRGGVPWETRMLFPYGYVRGSEGLDGDHVDVFLGPDLDAPVVYVIDQMAPPDFARVDEQKCMVGFAAEADAVAVYLAHYDDARFLGRVRALPAEDFIAAVRLTVDGEPFIKGETLFFKALGPGERWITAHPHGEGTKGVPILIREHPDGTATVIGGAAGKINHLKLRGIAPKGSYAETLRAKAQERAEARKQQVEADKAAGVHEQKVAARSAVKAEVQKARDEFVQSVAELSGWSDADLKFDEDKHAGLSDEARAKARTDHKAALFKRAKEAVDLNRQRLIYDADARAASGLGEIPLESPSPEQLSLADLEPMPEVAASKLGFAANYAQRAGLSPEEAKAEAKAALPPEEVAPEPAPEKAAAQAEAKAEKAQAAEKIAQELDAFRLQNPECAPPKPKVLSDAQKAAAMLKAQKRLRLVEQKAREVSRDIDAAPAVESKSYVLEVADAEVDEAAKKGLEEDVRTAGARSFLEALAAGGGEAKMAGHVGAGAFNALSAAGLSVGGDALIDRSVVDVLGIAGAAQVLARRLRADLGADAAKVGEGVEAWHLENQDRRHGEAMKQAQALHDAAVAIELPEAKTGLDLAAAQEANAKRRAAIAEAQRILGQAHGELQAGAALVAALRENPEHVEVSLGGTAPEQAVLQLRAIGLQAGDYHLDKAGDNLVARVTAAGMDRIAKPIDVAGMARVRRNLEIMEGAHDEDDWLPHGVARRPDLVMHVEPGVAERLAQPVDFSGGVEPGMRDYIGGRMADGDAMVDILADLQSAAFLEKAGGDPVAYRAALDAVAPLKGEGGKMRPVESLRESWEGLADAFVASRYGGERAPIHRQTFEVDQHAVDALHRALAETPEGVAAYKPIGDLTPQERNGLRNWWYAHVAREDPGAAEARLALEAHQANEPVKEMQDMFGETSVNPEWHAWAGKRDELAAAAKTGSLDWKRYAEMLGSPMAAIEAVQDMVRSRVSERFAGAFNTSRPGEPLKLGRTTIRHNLDHLDAVDPQAREARAAKERELIDAMRERVAGKYASGAVKDKLDEAREKKAAFEQAQMGFFATDDLFGGGDKSAPLAADERHTLGQAAEQKIAGMMSVVGQNFKPGQPTKLWAPAMSGGKNVARQRFLKMLEANGRVCGGLGTGSGKSLLQLSGFTHLHAQGKAHRGLILCPSVVQGQMGGEALRYLEPGKYKWHAEPGASREERLQAYRDPGTHFVVATHQSFRDDMIHLGAKHAGVSEREMADRLQKMTADQRSAWAKGVMETEGFGIDYMSVDESQYTLNREGKENSRLANIVDSFGEHMPYYSLMSGDLVKNDPSELADLMQKMDRKRYGDRGAFLRRYGGDAPAAKDALKLELARHVYSSKIDPPVKDDRKVIHVPLNDHQKARLAQVDKDIAAAKLAHMEGGVAVEEMRRLSPESFAGAPPEQHGEIAKALQKNVGLLRNAATHRVLNIDPEGAKFDAVSKAAAERKGKPGVIFARNLETVHHLHQRLEKEGYRVVSLTGEDSSKEKDAKRQFFQPEQGEARADILVASDAAATGLNLQRGMWLGQVNCPDTAMVHGQRIGRIFRTGQKNDVELLDFVADHPAERKARDRLAKKYQLRELMQSPMEQLDDTGVAWHIRQALAKEQGLGAA